MLVYFLTHPTEVVFSTLALLNTFIRPLLLPSSIEIEYSLVYNLKLHLLDSLHAFGTHEQRGSVHQLKFQLTKHHEQRRNRSKSSNSRDSSLHAWIDTVRVVALLLVQCWCWQCCIRNMLCKVYLSGQFIIFYIPFQALCLFLISHLFLYFG